MAVTKGQNEKGFILCFRGGKQSGDLILSWISSSHSLLFPQTDYRALKAPSAETDWLMGSFLWYAGGVGCGGNGV